MLESLSKQEDVVVVTDSADVVRKQPGLTTGVSMWPIVDELTGRGVARKLEGPSGIAERLFPSRRLDVRW